VNASPSDLEPCEQHAAPAPGSLRVCLAASGGGHLRQMLDLQPAWGGYDHFFVTEKSALGESVAKDHRAIFVQHYSFGQVRWGQPIKMLTSMIRNFFQSARLVLRERPDVVLTTGAGAVFWTCLMARALGARLILIESFARFHGPSKSGHMAKPFATDVVVQSAKLKEQWPEALIFDPFRMVESERPTKEPLILATVGATLPFDRLAGGMLELFRSGAFRERMVLQTGRDSAVAAPDEPERLRCVETLDFAEMKAILKEADIVVTHGGTGSLITALREGCRVVAMPRRFHYKELYDDHQLEIINAFADRGLIELALEPPDLLPAIERARAKVPPMATTDPSALLDWLEAELAKTAEQRSKA
jgi:UDP-N-acetylglucosamine--N-acetylmuramyl-(pentapeptide) pyrophosphoryl-undecaprenol N-acetylglucosamine transferase